MQDPKKDDIFFMQKALEQAEQGFSLLEVPVGAVIVDKNKNILSSAHNEVESRQDPTAHAEILCIQRASKYLNSWRLLETTLYTTLEPCSMCLGALYLSRVKKIVWGAPDLRHGACGSFINLNDYKHPTHEIEIYGNILEKDSAELMRKFFKQRREEAVCKPKKVQKL